MTRTYRVGILGLTHDRIWQHVADLAATAEVEAIYVADGHEDLIRRLAQHVTIANTYAACVGRLGHPFKYKGTQDQWRHHGGRTKRRPKLHMEAFYMRFTFPLALRRKPGHMARLSPVKPGRGERIRTSDLLNPMKRRPSFRVSNGTARRPFSRVNRPLYPPATALHVARYRPLTERFPRICGRFVVAWSHEMAQDG